MKPSTFSNSTLRAQALREGLRKVSKKSLKFAQSDEVFRIHFGHQKPGQPLVSLESHLWNPTREETLLLADGSLLRVGAEGDLEWIEASSAKRTFFETFPKQLRLPHAWATIQVQRAQSEEGARASFFATAPNRAEEEATSLLVARKAGGAFAISLAILFTLPSLFPKKEHLTRDEQPVPEAFVKLLTTPSNTRKISGAAPSVARESLPAAAVQQNLHRTMQSKSLQKTLARFLTAPSLELAARSPAGALPLAGKAVATGELQQKLSALSRLTESGPGLLGGAQAGGRLGSGSGLQVAGQGKAFVSLRLEDAKVEEGLTKDEVGEVIHRHAAEIRYCYEAAMLRRPDLEGKLAIAFTIGRQGGVLASRILQSSMEDHRLGDCVLAKLSSWKFPRPKGGIDVPVTYPFIFKSLGKG